MKKFRPIELQGPFKLRYYRNTGKHAAFNFVKYERYYPANYKFNNITLHKIFARLHYLASHAPKNVRKKYIVCYNRFMGLHFPKKASFTYQDNHSPNFN